MPTRLTASVASLSAAATRSGSVTSAGHGTTWPTSPRTLRKLAAPPPGPPPPAPRFIIYPHNLLPWGVNCTDGRAPPCPALSRPFPGGDRRRLPVDIIRP